MAASTSCISLHTFLSTPPPPLPPTIHSRRSPSTPFDTHHTTHSRTLLFRARTSSVPARSSSIGSCPLPFIHFLTNALCDCEMPAPAYALRGFALPATRVGEVGREPGEGSWSGKEAEMGMVGSTREGEPMGSRERIGERGDRDVGSRSRSVRGRSGEGRGREGGAGGGREGCWVDSRSERRNCRSSQCRCPLSNNTDSTFADSDLSPTTSHSAPSTPNFDASFATSSSSQSTGAKTSSPPTCELPSLPTILPHPSKTSHRSNSSSSPASSSLSEPSSPASTLATSNSDRALANPFNSRQLTFPSKPPSSPRRRLAPSSYSPFIPIPSFPLSSSQRDSYRPVLRPNERVRALAEEDELDRMIAAQSVDSVLTRRKPGTSLVSPQGISVPSQVEKRLIRRDSTSSESSGFSEYVDASEGEDLSEVETGTAAPGDVRRGEGGGARNRKQLSLSAASLFGVPPSLSYAPPTAKSSPFSPRPLAPPSPSTSSTYPRNASLAAPTHDTNDVSSSPPKPPRHRKLSSRLIPTLFRRKSNPLLIGIGSQDQCFSLAPSLGSESRSSEGSTSLDRGSGWAWGELENFVGVRRGSGWSEEKVVSPEVEVLGERLDRFAREQKERIRGIARRRTASGCI